MSIHVALHHRTKYIYTKHVTLGPQTIRLRPAPHSRTPILNYSLKAKPDEHFVNWQQDPQGNYLARLVFPEKTDLFQVDVDLTADMTIINPFDFFLESHAETYPFKYEPWLLKELKPFLYKEKLGPAFSDYLKGVKSKKQPIIDFLVSLNERLKDDIDYFIRMEPGVQTPEETLTKRSGSCRDSAWLLVNLLRHKGLAARFVSGYLIQLKADVQALDGPSGAQEDFTDLHAWTEVYLPGAGWVGLDPTSGLLTGEGHIPLVATPEPSSAAPITGSAEESAVDFVHEMKVTRIHEDPRVTNPYSDDQWKKIDLIGKQVDKGLEEEKVKLTMGGEPTFVSIDDMEGAQWKTAALGREKRELAEQLIRRLRKRWTKGALLYLGQGKWYPGEELPRWVLGCYWRKDGRPIWKDESLLADETKESSFTQKDAKKYIKTLAEKLKVDPKNVEAGYEDVFYYLWREEKLPKNVDPLKNELTNPLERKRIAKVFSEQIGEVIGYALPLKGRLSRKTVHWLSDPWKFRSKYMNLIPGDSPMGLRLPLDSLEWTELKSRKYLRDRDPLEERGDLDVDHAKAAAKKASNKSSSTKRLTQKRKEEDFVRTALCVQVREGNVYVFLPPVETMEEFIHLIARIEATSAELKIPVIIEGYAPPYDPRIDCFKITPDPGVIEVNVKPVASWDELVRETNDLFEEARQCRLGSEKFMLDGKHRGTGGGNHVVLGGETPAESPFLRRPDLLPSLLTYWNNHPALSYLFSGQFIGPTSQAPRVDEGRRDSIYELEIAMQQLEVEIEKHGQCPPWIVDRLFRHLLVDGTGNTHRSEFCIDKLYSPDSATGRLGLVELRGFEMLPHQKMGLAQQLLIRALVLKFWKEPFKAQLVRWDSMLHDRSFLPHFIREDFRDVLFDLNTFGIDLTMDLFNPHFEFRFPIVGKVQHKGMELELRSAIEPWYVLGEEPAGGGTSRYVDSSVERLQVKIRGSIDRRYVVCCNGRAVPLHPTGTQGEYVAGVRYRAWQPPSCLHPTIPVHSPLTFDIIDAWSRRSVGGCVYHVSHPGGRNYGTFPVNAFEAEARRAARFFHTGHTPGEFTELPQQENNPDFPLTLDLRREKEHL